MENPVKLSSYDCVLQFHLEILRIQCDFVCRFPRYESSMSLCEESTKNLNSNQVDPNNPSPPSKRSKIDSIDCSTGDKIQKSRTDMVEGSDSRNSENSFNTDMANGRSKLGSFDPQLYSRQLYALGEVAMRRLRISTVLISGIGGVGVEIAKNLILGGIRHVTIHDTKTATWLDLSAQYYLNEQCLGKNRAVESWPHLEELNDSVTVGCITEELNENLLVIITEATLAEQKQINLWTRKYGKKFIAADCRGLFGVLFNDFGSNHIIDDSNGEPCTEETGNVFVLEDTKHNLEDGDYVTFREVKGMVELNDCPPRKVKVINTMEFNIGDISAYSEHTEGGKAKTVKVPVKMEFVSLNEALLDPEILVSDHSKLDRPPQMHVIWQGLHMFFEKEGRLPRPQNLADAEQMLQYCEEINTQLPDKIRLEKVDARLAKMLSFQAVGNLVAMNGFIGGIAAQEAMKAVTGIFTPIHQWLYFDSLECLPETDSAYGLRDEGACRLQGSRYDGQAAVFGWNFQEALAKQKWLIVGAGAIGCELLKNFAMMGVACGKEGCLIITDMDNIELSNLNRQFLFRRSDVGAKKAEVAGKVAKTFNSQLNVVAMCERVGTGTENIFDDAFFEKLDGVANALDNIEARTYVDRRCVYYRLPLLDSGTQGPKGSTQVVYPFLTESYSSSHDPPEKSIPICTLRNFPNTIEHTIQWARDLFEGAFSIPAELANQFLDDPRGFFDRIDKMHDSQKLELLENVYHYLSDDRPATVEACVRWARLQFEQHFNFQIQQLLYSFPEDQLTAFGTKFWSGSKRCPHAIYFDSSNPEHRQFIFASAFLRAQMYAMKPIDDMDKVVELASEVKPPPFKPKIGLKIPTTDEEAAELAGATSDDDSRFQDLQLMLAKLKPDKTSRLVPIDFEKDDDTNHHMEFITAASNLRAENYKIEKADFMKTKQIAGRIIPAIATTTAAVAGLVGLEFYKIVSSSSKKANLERFKNSFMNLALPFFGFAEPIRTPVKKFYDKEWTLWDCLELKGEMTLKEFLSYMKEKFNVEVTMLSQGVSMLFSFFLPLAKQQQRMNMKVTDLVESITGQKIPSYVNAIVLETMCTDEHGEDIELPYIKYRHFQLFRFRGSIWKSVYHQHIYLFIDVVSNDAPMVWKWLVRIASIINNNYLCGM
ncbi:Ubiquitin-like modifier-activating enzyme 1 [Trichinella nativa]|uniref:E1 ubiquitin-activating enzyme n=1 Tax=Trichinella nativa TaxID=6335 RepID=A0A0V1LTP0_9BILA|nr:Ubiquitin-like modifier-activating enzyme 1 [Trichinella nativa]